MEDNNINQSLENNNINQSPENKNLNQSPERWINEVRQYSRQYVYSVRGTETDTKDEIQLFALLSMIQEAASIDAEFSNLGATVLDPAGYCWLLLRTSIRLSAIPKWQDKITIDTWTNGVERLFSIRDFAITDQNGQLMGKASTSWLVVDKVTHRPLKVSVLNDERVMRTSISALGFNSPKLEEQSKSMPAKPVISKYAGYSEIDRNFHVNNTRYIAWCLDAIGVFGIPKAKISGLDINYVSEVVEGETVDLFIDSLAVESCHNPQADSATLIVGKHQKDQKTAFISIFYWELL